jgi:hypothetical protein
LRYPLAHAAIHVLEEDLRSRRELERRDQAGHRHHRGVRESRGKTPEPTGIDHDIVVGERTMCERPLRTADS